MILAIDIGSGTQDILLYQGAREMQNMVKMILPSPTSLVAQKIREATRRGYPICLIGHLMGGGPSTRAIKGHLKAGLKVYAFPQVALTIKDDLEYVKDLGVVLVEQVPQGVLSIKLGDFCLEELSTTFSSWGIKMPKDFAFAVQDHGFSPKESNRLVRFRHWEKFLMGGGDLMDLVYKKAPPYFTRMGALQEILPQAVVMDTGVAAIKGSLEDPLVAQAAFDGGVLLVNVGNQHTLGALLQGEDIYGIVEHHTSLLTREDLLQLLWDFRAGLLKNEGVFLDGGHGVYYRGERPYPFHFTAVTGPKRDILRGTDVYFAAPYGDMMLTGCFGLIRGWKKLIKE